MIKLSARHTMVLDKRGTARTFDLDTVLTELRRCFRKCGVTEPWVADHITMVVEEQLTAQRGQQTELLQEDDVHTMVMSLLCASGYEDVARIYRENRKLPIAPADADDMRPWNDARLDQVLRHLLPLDEKERAHLVGRLTQALQQLQLSAVANSLIKDLAIHLLADGIPAKTAPPSERPDTWMMRVDDWPVARCNGDVKHCLEKDILRPYPVSRVLPRLRLRLDLIALAGHTGNPPLTELALLPAVGQTAAAAAALLANATILLDEIHHSATPVPPHLVVTGTDTVVADLVVPQCAKGAKRLRQDLVDIIQSRLEKDCGDGILVTFR